MGIADLDTIAPMNREANDLGLDAIDMGVALGVAAEVGLMQFGDGERALQLLAEVQKATKRAPPDHPAAAPHYRVSCPVIAT